MPTNQYKVNEDTRGTAKLPVNSTITHCPDKARVVIFHTCGILSLFPQNLQSINSF